MSTSPSRMPSSSCIPCVSLMMTIRNSTSLALIGLARRRVAPETQLRDQRRQLRARGDREADAGRKRRGDALEILAVAARIDDHDQTAVVFAADQPPDHLLQVEQHH